MSRGLAVFLVAVVVSLATGHLLRDTPGYVVRQPDGSYAGDITHYVYWTRLVTLGGIQSAYSGSWPETYAVYPPVTLYAYALVGSAYRLTQDPSFDPDAAQQSAWLHAAIKLVALAWHLLTAGAIFGLLRRLAGPGVAGVSAAAYVANPAALYDVAHWAQPDGAHALFSVVAIGLLSLARVRWAWAAMALAALAKPQAWAILPLVVSASLRWPGEGWRRLAAGLAVAGLVAAVVLSPFALTGHLGELLSLPGTISTVMPVVSADAHNFWWLVVERGGANPIFVFDAERFVGPLTYRLAAAGLVGTVVIVTCWLYWSRRTSLAEAAALSVLGWFTFTTQAHENHVFFALPLLALAWPTRRWLLLPYVVLSVSLLANMVLHDQLVLERLGYGTDDPFVLRLRVTNAALNVLVCLGWLAAAALRTERAAVAERYHLWRDWRNRTAVPGQEP